MASGFPNRLGIPKQSPNANTLILSMPLTLRVILMRWGTNLSP